MEPVIIKNGKREYNFSSDRLVITKRDKVIYTIDYGEIKEITYNAKFTLGDLYAWSSGSSGSYYAPNSFVVRLKEGKTVRFLGNTIPLRIYNNDFERVKNIVPIPIRII